MEPSETARRAEIEAWITARDRAPEAANRATDATPAMRGDAFSVPPVDPNLTEFAYDNIPFRDVQARCDALVAQIETVVGFLRVC
jgi:hypothetical protein